MFHRYELSEWADRYGTREHMTLKVMRQLPLIAGNSWLAGGAVRDFVMDRNPDSDFDVFFLGPSSRSDFIESLKQRPDFQILFENERTITCSLMIEGQARTIQAVTLAYYDSAEAVIDSFDFTATQFVINGGFLICGQFSLFDTARKRLAIHKVTYGASSVRRMLKYARKGFTVCQGCIVTLLEGMNADPSIINAEVDYVD